MGKKSGESEAKGGSAVQADIKRLTGVIEELSKSAPIKVALYVKQGAPHLATAAVYILMAMPFVAQAFTAVCGFVEQLPKKVIYASLGFAACFFGGIFPATIAAVEAFRLYGGKDAVSTLKRLYEQCVKAYNAYEEDKKVAPDAKDQTPQELIVKKGVVVFSAVDPDVVSEGLAELATSWVGVLAVLKVEFARTVTLGERIGEELYMYVQRFEPALAERLPEGCQKWVPVVMRCVVKGFAISMAWLVQRVVSAVHSAIRGGRVFGRNVVDFLHDRKLVNFTSDDGYVDELIGWATAAAGLLFQISLGFGLPFPLNFLLWPLHLVEFFIRWSVS